MTPEQEQQLRDMQGWLEYCLLHSVKYTSALVSLAHDSSGLLNAYHQTDGFPFEPRTIGYAQYLDE